MKNQALFSSKDKSKQYRLLHFCWRLSGSVSVRQQTMNVLPYDLLIKVPFVVKQMTA